MILLLSICLAVGLLVGHLVRAIMIGWQNWRYTSKGAPVIAAFYPTAFWLLMAFCSALSLWHMDPILDASDLGSQSELAVWVICWGALWALSCRTLYGVARVFEDNLENMPDRRAPMTDSAFAAFWLASATTSVGMFLLILWAVGHD